MIYFALVLNLLLQNHTVTGHDWDRGCSLLVSRAGQFDVSVADFQSREDAEDRMGTQNRIPTKQSVAVDRFNVVQSTMHSIGESLEAVSSKTGAGWQFAPFVKGHRYLLVTYPAHNGRLENLRRPADGSGEIVIDGAIPSNDPGEELCKVALSTEAGSLKVGTTPLQTLIASVSDCLKVQNTDNMTSAFEFLRESHYPDTKATNARWHPDNPVTNLLRHEASISSSNVRAAIFQILNSWGIRDMEPQIIEALVECSHDANAFVPSAGSMQPVSGETKDRGPTEAETFKALDGGTNLSIVRYFLSTSQSCPMSMDHDRKLAIYLDSPYSEFRYFIASHYAMTRHRDDLKPFRRTIDGVTDYPDLDQKAATWKTFFGIKP